MEAILKLKTIPEFAPRSRYVGRGGAATQAASGTNRFRLLLSAVYLLYMGSEILTGDASNPPLMNSE